MSTILRAFRDRMNQSPAHYLEYLADHHASFAEFKRDELRQEIAEDNRHFDRELTDKLTSGDDGRPDDDEQNEMIDTTQYGS